jgi:drug/metabolite transporter (DMT)-like permease
MFGKLQGYFGSAVVGDRKGALLLTVIAGLLWGTSFPAIKLGLVFVDPYRFVFFRMLIATVVSLLISVVTKNLRRSLAKEPLIWYLGLLNGVAYLIQYVGMNFTTASNSSLFVNLSAVWVAVLSWLVLKERFSQKKLWGILSGLVGVVFVTTNLNLHDLNQGRILGDALVFVSGILWSFFIVYHKKLANTRDAVNAIPWICVATTLPLLPFAVSQNISSAVHLPFQAWAAIIYTAVFCWLIPYYLWLKGLKHLSPVVSTIVLLTEVIAAITIALLLLGETVTTISGIGISLILLAIILVSIR